MIGAVMPQPLPILARAFELARSGSCSSVDDIRRVLSREQYDSVIAHLSGPSIKRDLLKQCRAAKGNVPA